MMFRWAESRSRFLVVAVTIAFYLCFTTVALARHDQDPLWFVWLGERYLHLDDQGRMGYDGQFAYYLARDGLEAIPHLDNPPYRLQRILYPMAVRLLSLGQVDLIPLAMLGINMTAIAGGTYVLARWLQSRRMSVWYALTFSGYVGMFLAYSRSLNEPLAVALAAGGVIAWWQRRHLLAAVVLALALLTKETMLLFVAGLALAALWRWPWRQWGWLAAAAVPLLLWEMYLYGRFGELPLLAGPGLVAVPLGGIVPHLTREPGRISALLFVGLPALGLLIAAAVQLRRDPTCAALWLLLLNALLMVFLPLPVYDHIMHAGRNGAGLVLAALFCFPRLAPRLRQVLALWWITPTLIWLIPVLRWAPWLSEI